MRTVPRSSIVEYPNNPRRISESARKKIKGSIKDVGLLEPLIVNESSGHLIGGHQRLSVLDELERYKPGGKDYDIDVSVVELNTEQEAKAVVFLNNPDAQGTWDLDKLAELFTESGVDIVEMGFDKSSLEVMFAGDSRFEDLFTDDESTQETKQALNDLKAMSEQGIDGPALTRVKEERDGFNKRRDDKANSDFYVVVVCDSAEEKALLMKHLNLPPGEQYIAPHEILSLVRP